MAINVGIDNDTSLPATLQNVNMLTPWPRSPVLSDFIGNTQPIMAVPILSWAVQYREVDIRTKLIAYLQTVFPDYASAVTTNINTLPSDMVNNVVGNVLYNTSDLYTYAILPRIDYAFCTSPYAFSPLWVAYYLVGALLVDFSGLTDQTSLYRKKQLTDLQVILGYTLRTILTTNPSLTTGNKVIVAATESSSERLVITCDNKRLNQYLNNGGTLNSLCSQWITQKVNPVIVS